MLFQLIPRPVDRPDSAWGLGVRFRNVKVCHFFLMSCALQVAITISTANACARADAGEADSKICFTRIDNINAFGVRSILSTCGHLAQIDAPDSNATDIKDDPRVKRWRLTLLYGALLVVIFITAAAAIIVFSRRWRQWIRGGRKTGPTDATDVWAMHRDPEVDEDDSSDEEACR